MGLLDAGAEEPKSKALRYGISGVVLVLSLPEPFGFYCDTQLKNIR